MRMAKYHIKIPPMLTTKIPAPTATPIMAVVPNPSSEECETAAVVGGAEVVVDVSCGRVLVMVAAKKVASKSLL